LRTAKEHGDEEKLEGIFLPHIQNISYWNLWHSQNHKRRGDEIRGSRVEASKSFSELSFLTSKNETDIILQDS